MSLIIKPFKMTPYYGVVVGLIALNIVGCTNSNVQQAPTPEISIQPSEAKESQKFDSLFSYSRHVILQTTDSSMIGKINKVLIDDNLIYIMSDNARISVFNDNGDYIKSFSHIGQGPGEYISLSDFDIKDSTIYLLGSNSIHKYSTDNSYEGSVSLRNSAIGLAITRNGIALNNGFGVGNSNTKDHYCYTFIPDDGEPYNEVEFNDALLGYAYTVNGQTCSFVRNGENILTMFPYSDTLYEVDIESGRLSARADIIMGSRNITPDSSKEEVKEILASDLPSVFYAIHSWKDKLMFSYICQGKGPATAMVSSGEVVLNGMIWKDTKGIPISFHTLNSTKETGEILSIVPSEVIVSIAERKDDLSQFPLLKEISANLTEESNPVLVFYHPKNVTE